MKPTWIKQTHTKQSTATAAAAKLFDQRVKMWNKNVRFRNSIWNKQTYKHFECRIQRETSVGELILSIDYLLDYYSSKSLRVNKSAWWTNPTNLEHGIFLFCEFSRKIVYYSDQYVWVERYDSG